MESSNLLNDIHDLEKDLNLFNDSLSSDFDDEDNDETYKVSHADIKELHSDKKEDVSTAPRKKVRIFWICGQNL